MKAALVCLGDVWIDDADGGVQCIAKDMASLGVPAFCQASPV